MSYEPTPADMAFLATMEKSLSIMSECLLINGTTRNTAILTLHGHVGVIHVQVYDNGWGIGRKSTDFEFRNDDPTELFEANLDALSAFTRTNLR